MSGNNSTHEFLKCLPGMFVMISCENILYNIFYNSNLIYFAILLLFMYREYEIETYSFFRSSNIVGIISCNCRGCSSRTCSSIASKNVISRLSALGDSCFTVIGQISPRRLLGLFSLRSYIQLWGEQTFHVIMFTFLVQHKYSFDATFNARLYSLEYYKLHLLNDISLS